MPPGKMHACIHSGSAAIGGCERCLVARTDRVNREDLLRMSWVWNMSDVPFKVGTCRRKLFSEARVRCVWCTAGFDTGQCSASWFEPLQIS